MRYRDIGTTRKISKIGLGTWQFGSRDWGYGERYADQVAHAIVRRALELGVTLFDTAEIYGFGRSERILGRALGTDRESVFLATKMFPLVPVAPVVEQRAVASANRLGVRRLDLYQVHQANPVIRDGTIMRGMDALQRVGLVDEVGYLEDAIAAALSLAQIDDATLVAYDRGSGYRGSIYAGLPSIPSNINIRLDVPLLGNRGGASFMYLWEAGAPQ